MSIRDLIPYRPPSTYEGSVPGPSAEPEPTASTDTPGIRLDDLLELVNLPGRSSANWTLDHLQIDGWGSIPGTVNAVYIVRRPSDQSLWAACFDLPPREDCDAVGDCLIPLTRVHACQLLTTVYHRPGKPGALVPVLATVERETLTIVGG